MSDVYLRRIETKVLVSGDIFIIPFFERFCKVDRKKVLKSDHPTEFGKTSKKVKNTVHCHRREGGYSQRQRESVRKLLNNRHPSLLFVHPMKNLTERGYSLLFVFFIVSVELSFLPHSTGTVASEFRNTWTSAKFLYTNVVPSGGGHVPRGQQACLLTTSAPSS